MMVHCHIQKHSDYGMMAVALTVFGVVVGMVSYRAGKRSGGSSTYESLA